MKGVLYAWIMITATVFLVGFLWIIFSQINEPIFDEFGPSLQANEDTANTYDSIVNTWANWPMLLIFGLIVFGLVAALRKEPNTQ